MSFSMQHKPLQAAADGTVSPEGPLEMPHQGLSSETSSSAQVRMLAWTELCRDICVEGERRDRLQNK